MKLGSGFGGEFTFLDLLSVASFLVGVQNLDTNLTQSDKQDLQNDFSAKADLLLKEIHGHLEQQDRMIKRIMEVLNIDDR